MRLFKNDNYAIQRYCKDMKNAQFYLREKHLIEGMPILIRTTETASSQRLKLKIYFFNKNHY